MPIRKASGTEVLEYLIEEHGLGRPISRRLARNRFCVRFWRESGSCKWARSELGLSASGARRLAGGLRLTERDFVLSYCRGPDL